MSAVAEAAPLEFCPHCGEIHPAHVLRCPDTDIILPLAGRMLDGRFRFIELIGRGGMASVWLARNERVDRLVAIKLIRPEVARDDDMVARFRAEARAAGRIGHPNICDILDSGRSPIGPYIVMEYLRGRSLGELLAECGRLSEPVAVMLVREALRGLEAAHKAGIIHRDLKPENLFLHRPETGDPTVKIMDFGVAKFIDGTSEVHTQHGALLGTPEYMAPEQFRGAAHAEPRTDIWAVGAILYRAITGQNAFGGPTIAATLLMVSSEDATPMDALVPDVSRALVRIVSRCLQRQPALRFADIRELDAALAPFAPHERDMTPWEATALPTGPVVREPAEPSAPTSPWFSQKAPAVTAPRRTPRAWMVALALFAGASAFAWWRGVSIDTLESTVADIEPPARDVDETPTPTAAATTPADAPEAKPDEPVAPTPRVVLVPPDEPLAPEPDTATTGAAADTDGAVVLPSVPPEPELDTTGEEPTPGMPIVPPSGDPEDTFRFGRYVAFEKTLPPVTHRQAKNWCDRLRATGHRGIRGWSLPNPSQSAKLVGHPSVRKGKYWTSALHRGRALVIALPSGSKSSISSTRGRARGICIARWP